MSDLKTRFRPTEHIPTPDLWPDISHRKPQSLGREPGPARRVLVAAFALAIAVAGFAFFARTFAGQERPEANVPPAVTNGVIAYRNIGGSEGVFRTIRPDGTDPRDVHVGVPGFVGVPSWSPDGTRIVFDVNSFPDPHPESGYFDIYAANADGSDPTRLTFDQNDHSPVWSPDGTQIAYVLGIGNVQQIVVMNADGSDPRQLTDTEGLNILPSWSPDRTRIAFVSWDGSNSDIYVMDADGSNVKRLTDDPSHEDKPVWSPDGHQIAFSRIAVSSGDSEDDGIFTMAADGTGITKLFHVPDPANVSFAWSPDETEMAITSITSHDGRTVGVLDLSTGILTPITDPGAWDGASWQPVPASAGQQVSESNAVPVLPLDPTVSSELAAHGITAVAVSDAGAVSPESALRTARGLFGFTGSALPTASLVRFTDSEQGPVQPSGGISATYVNREAWAIVYRGLQMPFIGGPAVAHPATYAADFVVFIDARTGRYLTAISMGT